MKWCGCRDLHRIFLSWLPLERGDRHDFDVESTMNPTAAGGARLALLPWVAALSLVYACATPRSAPPAPVASGVDEAWFAREAEAVAAPEVKPEAISEAISEAQPAVQPEPEPVAQPIVVSVPVVSTPLPAPFVRVETAQGREWFVVQRGEGLQPIQILPGETLRFDVEIDLGVGDLDVGDVELASGREDLVSSLPDARAETRGVETLEAAWVRSTASGGYMGYHVAHTLETRFLPQRWPRILHRDQQRGSENRNRELKLGWVDDEHVLQYRSDGHCKGCENKEHFVEPSFVWQKAAHCKKCKLLEHRAWHPAVQQAVPQDALDMLGAVWIARALVRDGNPSAVFPIADRQRLWEVTAKVGERKDIEVPAGVYRCRRVSLGTKLLRGSPGDAANTHFEGLFGIQGTLKIWLDEVTGTPVLIEGDLPIPVPLVERLKVRVGLKSTKDADPRLKKLR